MLRRDKTPPPNGGKTTPLGEGSTLSSSKRSVLGSQLSKSGYSDDEDNLSRSDLMSGMQNNATNCMICDAKLGKRNMNPRHHCRLCGRSICGKCSPSQIQFGGSETKPQRVCSTCITETLETTQLRSKLQQITEQLSSACGADKPGNPRNLTEAVDFCDEAADAAEQRLREMVDAKLRADGAARKAEAKLAQGHRDKAELESALSACEESLAQAESQAAGQRTAHLEALQRLREKIDGLSGRGAGGAAAAIAFGSGQPDMHRIYTMEAPATVEEALALCEASLGPVEMQIDNLKERGKRKMSGLWGAPEGPLAPPAASLPPSLPDTPASSFGAGPVDEEYRRAVPCIKGCPTQ